MRLLTRNADLKPSVCRYKYWQNFGRVSEVARKLVAGKVYKASIDPSTATLSEKKLWGCWMEVRVMRGMIEFEHMCHVISHFPHRSYLYFMPRKRILTPCKDSYIFFKCNIRQKTKYCGQTSSSIWFNRNWRNARTYSIWRWRYQISPKH
jgi:hypothetical protein